MGLWGVLIRSEAYNFLLDVVSMKVDSGLNPNKIPVARGLPMLIY